MNESYEEIENIWNRHQKGDSFDAMTEILTLLIKRGIKTRQDDGQLKQINISIPTSIPESFVIGLRYIKADGTQTEDHFLVQSNKSSSEKLEIEPNYKRKLEIKLKEYRGTHKQQVLFTLPNKPRIVISEVKTISFIKEK